MDKTSLYQQIDDQATMIEDLKEMVRIKDLTIKHQFEQMFELSDFLKDFQENHSF